MRKNLILLLAVCFIYGQSFAQTVQKGKELSVTTFKLSNGLTVYLNEDHTSPKIFGAMVVNAGSDNEDPNATGMAHYLEHLMFKGSDKIGTTDWPKESVILDSIRLKYDELGLTMGDEKRLAIQKQINEMSIRAAKYAIPNEVEKLLQNYGGTGLNAYTNYDRTVYHNSFPSNQLSNWMDIYAERFRSPVFRLFQSELETVYEEKNMRMDNFFVNFFDYLMTITMTGHPAGHHPIIGLTEHLKNPNLSKMYDFYHKYYVANNMALILTGDFDIETAKKWAEEKFSVLPSGVAAAPVQSDMKPLVGKNLIKIRRTPIKIGVLSFRGVPQSNPDFQVLDFANRILTNSSSTGLLDKLRIDNKLLGVFAENIELSDAGNMILAYIPKLIGQSLPKAEKLLLDELEKLKNGDFSDELVSSLKLEQELQYKRSVESLQERLNILVDAFINKTKWEDVAANQQRIKALTKADIQAVAKKYYSENFISIYSKTGLLKKTKLEKPPYKAVASKNVEMESEFAKQLKAKPQVDFQPKFIENGKDVLISDLKEKIHFYYTQNPYNDIFSLSLNFGIGKRNDRTLRPLGEYLKLIGTETSDFVKFKSQLQKIGASFDVVVNENDFQIKISGIEQNLAQTLDLVNELLTKPQKDDKQIKKISDNATLFNKQVNKEPEFWSQALLEYGLYGDKSMYLNRLGAKEIKQLTTEQLLESLKKVLQYEVNVHYVGTLNLDSVKANILQKIHFSDKPQKSLASEYKPLLSHSTNEILFVKESKALQNKINLVRDGNVIAAKDWPAGKAFSHYFGESMSSIIFQEIREFRSLAYACFGYYKQDLRHQDKAGYITCYLSTQADKTNEAIDAIYNILDKVPEKPERMDVIRNGLIQSINTDTPDFRERSNFMQTCLESGFSHDYRKDWYEAYKTLTFNDLMDFYKKNVSGKPTLITLVGNKSKIDMDKLTKYGKLKELSKEDIYKK